MSNLSSMQMVLASPTLMLFLIQCGFVLWAARIADVSWRPIITVIAIFSLWGLLSTRLALSGVYDSQGFLSLLPGLWLPTIPIFLGLFLFFYLPTIQRSFLEIARHVPVQAFVAIQAIRITALGTLIKTLQGQFPVSVELAIGLTDLAYGVSALLLYRLAKAQRLSSDAIALWHIVGILIVIIPGELAIQTALPGPLEVFAIAPTASVMLDYPMVLAPSLVVPIFFLLNALGATAAIAQSRSRTPLKPLTRDN